MKLPPFTLVHQRNVEDATVIGGGSAASRAATTRVRHLLTHVEPNFKRTLLASAVAQKRSPEGVRAVERVAERLNSSPNGITIGLWDLGVRTGSLPQVISKLNAKQDAFTFFEVQAAIPAGLVSHADRLTIWVSEHSGKGAKKKDIDRIEGNVIDEDYFKLARIVRRDLGLGYLIGITPHMIAGIEDDDPFWNRFASSSGRYGKGRLLLISAYHLREDAKRANRPFEVSVSMLIVAQLLIAVSSQLSYHDDVADCIFNSVARRETVIEAIKKLDLEPECVARVAHKYREAASTLIGALRTHESGE